MVFDYYVYNSNPFGEDGPFLVCKVFGVFVEESERLFAGERTICESNTPY